MSHGHSHSVEEHPEVKATSAIYLILILVGFILGLMFFVKTMSASDHHDDTHGTEHHTSVSHSDHSWDHSHKPLEFSSKKIKGEKEESPIVEVPSVSVTVIDSANATAPVADSTASPETTTAK